MPLSGMTVLAVACGSCVASVDMVCGLVTRVKGAISVLHQKQMLALLDLKYPDRHVSMWRPCYM